MFNPQFLSLLTPNYKGKHLPATHAVVKHAILASVRTLSIRDAISFVLCGQTAFHTPTAIASVDILANPAIA